MPFHQIVIFAHLTVMHYFYFIFEKNYCLNKIYHISKMLRSCDQKSFDNTENPSETPPPPAEFRPPQHKILNPPLASKWCWHELKDSVNISGEHLFCDGQLSFSFLVCFLNYSAASNTIIYKFVLIYENCLILWWCFRRFALIICTHPVNIDIYIKVCINFVTVKPYRTSTKSILIFKAYT